MRLSRGKLFGLVLSTLLVISCNFSSILSTPPSLPTATQSIAVTLIQGTPLLPATLTARTNSTLTGSPLPPTAAGTSTPDPTLINHKFANMSIDIPTRLARTVDFKVVNAAPPYHNQVWVVAPAYVLASLVGYPAPEGTYLKPEIRIYPAQDYAAVNQAARASIQRLKTIQANPNLPLTNESLPWLPFTPGEQSIAAQARELNFAWGTGVRFVTQYDIFLDPKATAPGDPIVNRLLFYHFQGLSRDGKYIVIALLPVSSPILSNDPQPQVTVPPGGVPYPGQGTDIPRSIYFRSITDALNAAGPGSFSPGLQALDGMLATLQLTP